MKKILAVASLAGIMILQSCVSGKDWKCECSKQILTVTFNNTYIITDQPKGDAEKICEFYRTEYEWENCTLSEF